MKRQAAYLLGIGLGLLSFQALAEAPDRSPRPDQRPGTAVSRAIVPDDPLAGWAASTALEAAVGFPLSRAVVTPDAPVAKTSDGAEPAVVHGPAASPLPRLRPRAAASVEAETDTAQDPGVPEQPTVVLAVSRAAVTVSPRPDIRPPNLQRRAIVQAAGVRVPVPRLVGPKGSVCGDSGIIGQRLSAIPGRLKGCGVANPVRVTAVAGVVLSQPSTLNCTSATALKRWVQGTVKPTVGKLGGGVAALRVAAHYSCRTRNNVRGAKISEHGRGNAIDISAIILKNGVALTVLKGWRDKAQGKLLRAMHARACGTFGTVLGPKADRYHQDHFHFDVARHRGGAYCR